MINSKKFILFILFLSINVYLFGQIDSTMLSKDKFNEEEYWDKLRVSLYMDSNYNASYDYQFYINSGIKKIHQKEYKQALNDFRRSLSILNNTKIQQTDTLVKKIPSPILLIGYTKSLLGETDSAIYYYRKCISSNISVNEAYNELGSVYINQNMVDSALLYFNKSYNRDRKSQVSIYNIGYSYFLKKEYETAEKYLNKVAEINPHFNLPYIILGHIYSIENNPNRAKKYYTQAIEANPSLPIGYYFRGFNFMRAMKLDLAYKDFTKLYELDTLNVGTLAILSALDFYSNRYSKGISHLQKIFSLKADKSKQTEVDDFLDVELISIINDLYENKVQGDEKKLGYEYLKGAITNNWYSNYRLSSDFIEKNQSSFATRLYLLSVVKNNYHNFSDSFLDDALRKDSTIAIAWYIKGLSLIEKKDFKESIIPFTHSSNNQYYQSISLLKRGISYKITGNYEQAINDLSKVLTVYKSLSWAYFSRGESYMVINQYDKALNDFQKFCYLNPIEYNPIYYTISKCYSKLQQIDSSKFYLDKYLKLDSALFNQKYYYNKKVIFVNESYIDSKYDKYALEISKIINISPKNIETLYLRGSIYLKNVMYNLAIDDYTKCIDYLSNDLTLKNRISNNICLYELSKRRGVAYFLNKKYDRAIEDFQFLLKENEDDIIAAKKIADCYFLKQDYFNAIKYYDIITKDSSLYEIIIQKGLCYSLLNDHKNAIDLFLKAISIDSANSILYGNLGREYYKLGDFNKCILYSQKAYQLNSQAFYEMYNIALSNLRLNNFDEAKRIYQLFKSYNLNKGKPIPQEAIDDLFALINKGICVNEARDILKNVFNIQI